MPVSTDLEDYVDALTKCSNCGKKLNNLRSLPCLHPFCLKCIKDHSRGNLPIDHVDCPVCHNSFVIPDGEVENLPVNFFLESLAAAKKATSKPTEMNHCMACNNVSGGKTSIEDK